jgi:hypothetical protein
MKSVVNKVMFLSPTFYKFLMLLAVFGAFASEAFAGKGTK